MITFGLFCYAAAITVFFINLGNKFKALKAAVDATNCNEDRHVFGMWERHYKYHNADIRRCVKCGYAEVRETSSETQPTQRMV